MQAPINPLSSPCTSYSLADSMLQALCFPCVHLWSSSKGCSHQAGLSSSLFLKANCCLCYLKGHHNCLLYWTIFDTKLPSLLERWQLMRSDSSSSKKTNTESKTLLCAASELHTSPFPCQVSHQSRRMCMKWGSLLAVSKWVFKSWR